CGLIKRDTLEHVDIGFAMLPENEGKGYGYESSVAVLKLAKEVFKLQTIVAITLPTNAPSIKLIEKLGLTYQKRVKPFDTDEELLLFAKTLNKH
ncbi:MAG: GNAT family N-acetyltransferase, partial [Oceanihabitans sp.]|nr:GNAT family N-acetyltransferase [Oceanihabitans sp.]